MRNGQPRGTETIFILVFKGQTNHVYDIQFKIVSDALLLDTHVGVINGWRLQEVQKTWREGPWHAKVVSYRRLVGTSSSGFLGLKMSRPASSMLTSSGFIPSSSAQSKQ